MVFMFEHYIYQPFFNILVGIYLGLGKINPEMADMGITVILFSLVIRVILLPLTLAGELSDEEKRAIEDKVKELNVTHAHDPIKLKEEIKKVLRSNIRSVLATTFNLVIQLAIILMLYRIFTTGLEGGDFYLLYDFMPRPGHINLLFLGKYDLAHTNSTLNLIQSVMIFVVELLGAIRSTYAVSRKNIVLLQLVLPVGSYIIFMFMPAGKKVFIIASLAFTVVYQTIKIIQEWLDKLITKLTPPPPPITPPPTTS